MSSAFPRSIEELVPQAERLSREMGRLPSQNQLKAALHVRAERAREVLRRLKATGFDPTGPQPDTSTPHLHAVPNNVSDPETVPLLRLDPMPAGSEADLSAPVKSVGEPGPMPRSVRRWPVILLAAPAFVAIWSVWVGIGELAGFGPVRPLPGIADRFTINSAITLPIGMETYAAYALRVWLAEGSPARARRFAKHSAITAFVLGGLGQIAYHLMKAAHMTAAPWPVTAMVSCLPVLVLGFGAALVHLQQEGAR
jgi:hypothetical protein